MTIDADCVTVTQFWWSSWWRSKLATKFHIWKYSLVLVFDLKVNNDVTRQSLRRNNDKLYSDTDSPVLCTTSGPPFANGRQGSRHPLFSSFSRIVFTVISARNNSTTSLNSQYPARQLAWIKMRKTWRHKSCMGTWEAISWNLTTTPLSWERPLPAGIMVTCRTSDSEVRVPVLPGPLTTNDLEQVIYIRSARVNSAFHLPGVSKWVTISIW